jgi:NAD-specific glutamate dehydrogenase
VVAADKAQRLSDIANAISIEWPGSRCVAWAAAQADHKKMGITAKGAWEA